MATVYVALAVAAFGCGRVGFDAVGADSLTDADPSAPDAKTDRADARPMVCGDGFCENETCSACALDCSTGDPICGNGMCDGAETSNSCFDDCGPTPLPDEWLQIADEIVILINMHRATGTNCPMATSSPVAALSVNQAMARISQNHAWDASHHDYDPTDGVRCSGLSIFDIMVNEGFSGPRGAAGFAGSSLAAAAVDFWITNDVTCPILMDGTYTEIGVGHADDVGGPFSHAIFH